MNSRLATRFCIVLFLLQLLNIRIFSQPLISYVIHASEEAGVWQQTFNSVFLDTLRDIWPGDVNMQLHYLDTENIRNRADMQVISEYLKWDLGIEKPDVIIAALPGVIDFFIESGLYNTIDIPVIYTLATPVQLTTLQRLDDGRGKTFTFPSAFRSATRATLELTRRLLPERDKILFISGSHSTDVRFAELVESVLDVLPDEREVQWLTGLPLPQLKQRLRDADDRELAIMISYSQDNGGSSYTLVRELPGIVEESSIPIFGMYDSLADTGLVGGAMTSSRGYGKGVAELARDVVFGEAPGVSETEIAVTNIIDLQAASTHGIPKIRIPGDSRLINRPNTLFARYGLYVILVFTALVLETLLIIGLFFFIRQRNLERRLKEAALQESLANKELLIRETHHRIKNNFQVLSSLISLKFQYHQDPDVYESINDIIAKVQSISSVHEMASEYETPEGIELKPYLQPLIADLARMYNGSEKGISMDVRLSPMQVPFEYASIIGLVTVELITNSFKYAFPDTMHSDGGSPAPETGGAPHHITVVLEPSDGGLSLQVADNGIGVDDGFSIEEHGGTGLQLVKSMVEQLEGTLTVQNGAVPGGAENVKFILCIPGDFSMEQDI
ncbi:sensor histidine kinase [Salinispira pacifica]|uniref:Sensory transduction histidine kinase n=1 Tax=Salinispira pacifica TaxID=1307761 RepID=V5WHT8_9SPIO|nr:histidine kinase dimerization/phosphoacceptor domain -containing protein [Salinispira pacifica]AHC14736.1 sensory transduction histidine kinase [Salinispira pacifica]